MCKEAEKRRVKSYHEKPGEFPMGARKEHEKSCPPQVSKNKNEGSKGGREGEEGMEVPTLRVTTRVYRD